MGLVLLLVAASGANSGEIQALPEDSRVFYVFSHDRIPQRQRVLQLWRQFSAQDAEQRFVAITRDEQVLAMVEGLTLLVGRYGRRVRGSTRVHQKRGWMPTGIISQP